jgi:Uma2 family endonuclease
VSGWLLGGSRNRCREPPAAVMLGAGREQTVAVRLRKWTREEYDRLVAAGVLGEDERVQLVEGEIVEMSPQSAAHATAVCLVEEALRRTFGEGFVVRVQLPLALGPESEPDPDVAVVRGGPRDYRDRHPTGEETVLVVEVAESTWRFDRERKGKVYAEAGVGEYWILSLEERVLEVYRGPGGGGYREGLRYGEGDAVVPLARPEARVEVAELLP